MPCVCTPRLALGGRRLLRCLCSFCLSCDEVVPYPRSRIRLSTIAHRQEWVAIKVLDKEKIQKQNMGAQVKKEISIMKLVRHPHVVQLKEVLASRTKIFIVLELVTGGELFDKIVGEGRFKEKTARFYFQQLCVGTEYCHVQGVCHRDLKPENRE